MWRHGHVVQDPGGRDDVPRLSIGQYVLGLAVVVLCCAMAVVVVVVVVVDDDDDEYGDE